MYHHEPSVPSGNLSIPILSEQFIHSLNLVPHALHLIRPAPNANVRLDAYNALFVQHGVSLADQPHHLVPRPLCSESVDMFEVEV